VTQRAGLRDVYAQKGLAGIPRLLTLMDRNEHSPTYGCMDREYWLCRSTDFPSSIAQFGAQALAIAYTLDAPNNPYRGHPKIRRWVEAAIAFLTRIQHRDGSFDEFYPNERGWAGPTGFLVYAMLDSRDRLGSRLPPGLEPAFHQTIAKAARFLCDYDEAGVLANHHAIALTAIGHSQTYLRDERILRGLENKKQEFLRHCDSEGWCFEYDGADPGYLSATVSFLAKLEEAIPGDERMTDVMRRAVDYVSYFAAPDGSFGGTIGSRNTLHFYPAGFERMGAADPMAQAVAEHFLHGLSNGRLVPPEIMDDRYFVYRVPELLLAYEAWRPRKQLPLLPYRQQPFEKRFPAARTWVKKTRRYYLMANLGKGGVVRAYDAAGALKLADAGFQLLFENGRSASPQWMDPAYAVGGAGQTVTVSGHAHYVVQRLFTPWRFVVFRVGVLLCAWQAGVAYRVKGWIRKALMLGARPAPVLFLRTIVAAETSVSVSDQITLSGKARIASGTAGDDTPVRYVPQSRYFQPAELSTDRIPLSPDQIATLNAGRPVTVSRRVEFAR